MYSRLSEQELLVSDCVLIPTAEEHGLQAVDQTSFLCEGVDRMGPELRDELDDRVCTVNDAGVRAVVYRKMERRRLDLLRQSCVRLQ